MSMKRIEAIITAISVCMLIGYCVHDCNTHPNLTQAEPKAEPEPKVIIETPKDNWNSIGDERCYVYHRMTLGHAGSDNHPTDDYLPDGRTELWATMPGRTPDESLIAITASAQEAIDMANKIGCALIYNSHPKDGVSGTITIQKQDK